MPTTDNIVPGKSSSNLVKSSEFDKQPRGLMCVSYNTRIRPAFPFLLQKHVICGLQESSIGYARLLDD